MFNSRSKHRPDTFCGRKGPTKDSTGQLVKHWVHLRNQPKYLKVQQLENLLFCQVASPCSNKTCIFSSSSALYCIFSLVQLSSTEPLQSGFWEGTNAEVTCSYSDLGVWLLNGEYMSAEVCR